MTERFNAWYDRWARALNVAGGVVMLAMAAVLAWQGITTTDAYQYINCGGATKVTLQISNAAVSVGFGTGPGGSGVRYEADEAFLPVIASLSRRCDQVRIKNLNPGQPAVVLGSMLGPGD